ncbi:unnamed protein product [Thelazia callipaeda]|uniref:SRCR domain-containing protein n=1 Tax=Thelazia callipaeda TaxID=103827 RepID=A0A0N5CR10_THECL|nr:unnamed protein product [Thelazia callipaeda]
MKMDIRVHWRALTRTVLLQVSIRWHMQHWRMECGARKRSSVKLI